MSKSRTILIITSACSAYLLSPKANLKIEKGKKMYFVTIAISSEA